ncbi:hypothetical protein HanRHA438_Chr10g0471641 [Helianthus annuus]|nr:hypothetical protein HanRHA438_Chr10g0471641 [Helianthus annuus]
MVHPPKLDGMEDGPSNSPPHHFYVFFFFLNGKFRSLTGHWSIIVPPAEPPDHIHLH